MLGQLIPGCHKQSFEDYPPGNDASSDGSGEGSSSSGGAVGDDSFVPPGDDSSSGGGSDCVLPSGTYSVTAMPEADADPSCVPWTSTVTFPPSTKANDAGVTCTYTPSGQLPLCAVDFICNGLDDAGMLTTITGFIEVDGTSISGTEEIQSPTGDEIDTTCSYTLTYVKH